MKKILALLTAAVFAAGTGLVEAAPKKAAGHHAVAGKSAPKAKKVALAKSQKHKKAAAAKHGKSAKKAAKKPMLKKKHR